MSWSKSWTPRLLAHTATTESSGATVTSPGPCGTSGTPRSSIHPAVQVETLHKAVLTLDGQESVPIEDKDSVIIQASEHTVRFVRLQEPDYFYRNLTSKMNKRMIGKRNDDG